MGKNALGFNKNERAKRVSGEATIKTNEKKAKIAFTDEENLFDNGKHIKTFDIDDLPRFPKGEEGYFVVLNGEGDEVENIGPLEGVYSAKCVDLSRPEEESDPQPFEVQPKNEKWDSYLAFMAFFKIVSGPYKGVQIPYFLHYKFEESREDAGMTAFKGNPENKKATRLQQLVEFCEKLDLIEEPIEWNDDGNILPTLLERIEEGAKTVKIVVKNGYINSLLSAHSETEEKGEEDEDEDEKPAKGKGSKEPPKSSDEEEEEL